MFASFKAVNKEGLNSCGRGSCPNENLQEIKVKKKSNSQTAEYWLICGCAISL